MPKPGPADDFTAEFDPNARRSFLLSIKNSKKRKAKRAEKLAEEALRKDRAERRQKRKEERDEVVQALIDKQAKIGLRSLPLYVGGGGVIPMAEVDAAKPTEMTLSEVTLVPKIDPPAPL
jgi:hypothetical protein